MSKSQGNRTKNNRETPAANQKKMIPPVWVNLSVKQVWISLAVIVIATFVIYGNAVSFGLLQTWDDNLYITRNPDIKALGLSNIHLFFTRYYANNYQPLSMLLYAIEFSIGHGRPAVFHFTNILLHAGNAVLIFFVVRKLWNRSFIPALLTSALFAVHPMHVESVAWVAERKDVLYSFFFLLALINYLRYLDSGRTRDLAITFVLFLLSCLSKSAAVVLPVVLVLFDFYKVRRVSVKSLVEKIPFFLVSVLFGLVAIKSQENSVHDMAPQLPALNHFLIVSYSFMAYIIKAFVPVHLSGFYPYPPDASKSLPALYYLSLAGTAVVIAAVLVLSRKNRELLFGFLFFVINIILVLQVLPVGAAIMADRYSYIPYIGIFFVAGVFLEKIILDNVLRKYESLAVSSAIVVILVFSALSIRRVSYWENDDVFFTGVIKDYPYASQAYKNRGSYFLGMNARNSQERSSLNEKAISDFENLAKYSGNDRDRAIAFNNIGVAKATMGDFKGAADYYSRAVGADSTWSKAYSDRGALYESYFAGNLYSADESKRTDYLLKATADFASAMKHAGTAAERAISNYNTGCVRMELKDYQGSLKFFDEAVKLDNNYSDALNNRGSAKNMLKDYRGAIEDFNRVIELNPKNPAAYFNRGVNRYALSEYTEAISDFSRALMMDGSMGSAYNLRANSYMRLGQYGNAVKDFDAALKINPKDQNSTNGKNNAQSLLKKQ